MRAACLLLASASCLLGAVDGIVTNATTGQPQPSVIVSLLQPGAGGMQTLASVKAGADGKFKIDKDIPPGPALVQALYKGATYNVVLTPGSPTTGVQVTVNDATNKAGIAKIEQHILVIEPSDSAIKVTETLIVKNDTKVTFLDSAKGSVRFYVPESASEGVQISIDAPGGMPIRRPAEKTTEAGVYKESYPIKPGETRFDVAYSLPAAATFSGKNLEPEQPARLATPSTVTLSGDGVESMGQEPTTKAHIYSVAAPTYEVKIEGTGSLRATQDKSADDDSGQPKIEEVPARVYDRLYWVLGLALAILFLGGALLYRRGAA